jgi:saccharopine dehydrogenase-like NADP-dependent oxidoreductase
VKVLLVGVGGVGEAIANLAEERPWIETMVLADYNYERAKWVSQDLGGEARFPPEFLDASDKIMIAKMAREYDVDVILNACDAKFNIAIFDAAFEAGKTYIDLAMCPSKPHPEEPYRKVGAILGAYQLEQSQRWADRGLLAICAMGVDPGLSQVFARFAYDNLFDEIHEINIRDGSNIGIEGYEFAPSFSIWTVLEECLNPPLVFDESRGGHYTTELFSDPEIFDFPDGIGRLTCVNIEHEEVVLLPRSIPCKRVTFKYGLDDDFIATLKTIHSLGLASKEPVRVGRLEVAPRDVVAACLPDPSQLGERMYGKACVGTWIRGIDEGKDREVYLYQVIDNAITMDRYQIQVVVLQTAMNPIVALEMLREGYWQGKGVLGPSDFPAEPYLQALRRYGFGHKIRELVPAAQPEPEELEVKAAPKKRKTTKQELLEAVRASGTSPASR